MSTSIPPLVQKIGNWVSAILLGNTREFIARIDERTLHMLHDIAEMKKDMNVVKQKVDEMSPTVEILWKNKIAPSNSPRQLNEQGQIILQQSGIKEIVDSKKTELFNRVKALEPKNAYDAEKEIEKVMNQLLEYYPELVDTIKDGAFRTGEDIITVLYVGSIYLRNLIFADLGFSMVDSEK